MIERRQFTLVDGVLLVVVVAVAALCRLGYLHYQAADATNPGPYRVQENRSGELTTLVTNSKEGNGFKGIDPVSGKEEKTSVAPGYPWLLSLVARWVDAAAEPGSTVKVLGQRGETNVRWIQAALGTLAAGLYFLFALGAFRSVVAATLAGILCAIYPFWIVNTAEINDGALTSFVLALSLYLGLRGGQAGGVLTSLVYGLSLAALTLIRLALVPLAFASLLWYLLRCRQLPGGWLCALLAFFGFGIGVAPWTVHNVQEYGDPLPLVYSANANCWIGNNSQATGGPESRESIKTARGDKLGLESEPDKTVDAALAEETGDHVDFAARAAALRHAAWNNMRNDSAGAWQRRIWAGLCFVFGDAYLTRHELWKDLPPASTESAEKSWIMQSFPTFLCASLFGMLVLSFIGWRWTYGWRYLALPSSLAVLFLPLPYILGHGEEFSGPRLPLDGVLLTYAAFAICCLIPGIGGLLFAGREVKPGITAAPRPVV